MTHLKLILVLYEYTGTEHIEISRSSVYSYHRVPEERKDILVELGLKPGAIALRETALAPRA